VELGNLLGNKEVDSFCYCGQVKCGRSPRLALTSCCAIVLPVVLYGCETRSIILREERGLRVLRIGC